MKSHINFSDLTAELEVLELVKIRSTLAIHAIIKSGSLFVGDMLVIDDGEKVNILYVDVILIHGYQPVNVAVSGEEVYIPVSPPFHKTKLPNKLKAYREYTQDLANLGFFELAKNTNREINEILVAESFQKSELYHLTLRALNEGVFDDLVRRGLSVLLKPVKGGAKFAWDNKKGISIMVALGVIANKLWNKYSDPCNRPFRSKEEKLRCLQQAADRVAAELRKEQNTCLQLQDPVQRRKCLWKVEKMRREWTQKSAQLKAEIYGK